MKVGQKVICIDGNFYNENTGIPPIGVNVPKKGDILTIRIIEDGCMPKLVYFRFEEIVNKKEYYLEGFSELNFSSSMFRPIQEDFVEEALEKAEKEYKIEVEILTDMKHCL